MTRNLDILFAHLPNLPPNAPPWKSTLLHDPLTNTVFVPAWLAGPEPAVALCASYDGVEVARYHGHPFVPHTWMAKTYPQTASAMIKIAESVDSLPPEDETV